MTAQDTKVELNKLKNNKKAATYARFFKTGKGEYGEGDKFLGLTTPQTQKIAQNHYKETELKEIQILLKEELHECRSCALGILKRKYTEANSKGKGEIVKFYIKNAKNINNWDLVDMSAHYILGDWLLTHPENKNIIYEFSKSKNLWKKRIAIISTFAFVRQNQFDDTLKLSMILMYDKHDLIHKATGWMLREVGKRDQDVLEDFLGRFSKIMPRTTLRYSIEKLSEEKRKFYMAK